MVIESEPHITEWTSSDGVTWESRHPPQDFDGSPIASGWLWFQSAGEPTPWEPGQEATDDTTWYVPWDGAPVAFDMSEAGVSWPMGDCRGTGDPISSNTFVQSSSNDAAGLRDICIITFDEVAT